MNPERRLNLRTPMAAAAIFVSLLGAGACSSAFGDPAPGAVQTARSPGVAGAAVTTTAATGTSGTSADTPEAERTEHATRLREVLQPLVDDTTLTAEQLDKVVETLTAAMPDHAGGMDGDMGGHGPGMGGHGPGIGGHVPGMGPGMGGKGPGAGLDAAATALGTDAATLRTELQGGKTIAQVAEDKGVDVSKVVDAIVTERSTRIDQAVTDGKLTAEQATTAKDNLKAKVTEMVNNPMPDRRGRHHDGAGGTGAGDATTTTQGG